MKTKDVVIEDFYGDDSNVSLTIIGCPIFPEKKNDWIRDMTEEDRLEMRLRNEEMIKKYGKDWQYLTPEQKKLKDASI